MAHHRHAKRREHLRNWPQCPRRSRTRIRSRRFEPERCQCEVFVDGTGSHGHEQRKGIWRRVQDNGRGIRTDQVCAAEGPAVRELRAGSNQREQLQNGRAEKSFGNFGIDRAADGKEIWWDALGVQSRSWKFVAFGHKVRTLQALSFLISFKKGTYKYLNEKNMWKIM